MRIREDELGIRVRPHQQPQRVLVVGIVRQRLFGVDRGLELGERQGVELGAGVVGV